MFYSETLLSKTGPLARVWLASNLERKLGKQAVLSSDLNSNVKDIIGIGQAPMALRLSGHLLLGVVRIYSRKARYLLDDCSDALARIKLAFSPAGANVGLLGERGNMAVNPNALILADTITEIDLFQPLPDPDDLFRETEPEQGRLAGRDPTELDFGASQLLTQSAKKKERFLLDDDDLGLDLGLNEPSIEVGRRAETPRRDEPSFLLDDDDLGIDLGLGDTTMGTVNAAVNDDMAMGGVDDDDGFVMPPQDDDEIDAANAAALARVDAEAERRQRARESGTPDSVLSQLRPSVERDLEETFRLDQTAADLDEDPTVVQAAQRAKRRRVMQPDLETELHNKQMSKQQEDRSAITKAPDFLPRDPLLLQLMELQRRGEFVSSIMGDGAMRGWAPELRGIASLEIIRQAGEKKRKRDSGVADLDTGDERQTTPLLELPLDEDEDEGFAPAAGDFGADTTVRSDGVIPLGADDDQVAHDEDEYAGSPGGAAFDTTEAPLLHPSQSGPVSLGTKSAVHLLRSYFAPDHATASADAPTPSKRTKAGAMFTDLCPEARTSRQDATKMFFELLVLGTKDAIKVEQDSKDLGGPIRVRGKRGLWGDWAEMGEASSSQQQQQQQQRQAEEEVEAMA